MSKTLIAALAASASLMAADAPKPLSPDFMKAGLKALVSVKNGVVANATAVDQSRVASALDDAEAAASTEGDKRALTWIQIFRFQLDNDAIKLRTRITNQENYFLFRKHSEPRYHRAEIADAVAKDPDTLKDQAAEKACGDALEKILRSASFPGDVAECGVTKP